MQIKNIFFGILFAGLFVGAAILYFIPPSEQQRPTITVPVSSNTETKTTTEETASTTVPLPDTPEIVVSKPLPDSIISSPLEIEGQVIGSWMFEASMPVSILDGHKKVITTVPATTKDNWMTTDFVNFTTTITFKKPTTATGFLLFKNDNPSGLEEYSKSYMIPIRFE